MMEGIKGGNKWRIDDSGRDERPERAGEKRQTSSETESKVITLIRLPRPMKLETVSTRAIKQESNKVFQPETLR